MTTTVPVFVSSTFSELQAHRSAVRDALHRLELVVRGMEYFGARPDTPKVECLAIVRSCRFYVGIVAMRYGSIDAATGKSFTHLEYDEAQRLGLPTLIYLIDEDRQPVLPKHVDRSMAAEKLDEFKETLKARHVVSFFTSPEDLAVRVSQDLPGLIERAGTPIRRGELAKLVESLPRVQWLTPERFAFLKKEVGEEAAKIQPDEILRETLEFLLAGDRLAAVFLISRRVGLSMDDAMDTLMAMDERLVAVIKRGQEIMRTG